MDMVAKIVLSDAKQDVSAQVEILCERLTKAPKNTESELIAARAFIEEFANNFVFIVEVPIEYLDQRNIIKVSYDEELGNDGDIVNMFSLDRTFSIESPYIASAASSHLEVHAPDGLQVISLWQS